MRFAGLEFEARFMKMKLTHLLPTRIVVVLPGRKYICMDWDLHGLFGNTCFIILHQKIIYMSFNVD